MGRALRKAKPAPKPVRAKRTKQQPPVEEDAFSAMRETIAISLFVFAIFLSVSIYSFLTPVSPREASESISTNTMGPVGAAVSEILFSYLGWCSFVTVLWALLLARAVWKKAERITTNFVSIIFSVSASAVMAIACATAAAVVFGHQGGGAIGSTIAFTLIQYVNEAGTLLISMAMLFVSFGVATGIGTTNVVKIAQGMGKSAGTVAKDTVFVVERGGVSVFSGILGSIRALWRSFLLFWKTLLFGVKGVGWFGRAFVNAGMWFVRLFSGKKGVESKKGAKKEHFVLGSDDQEQEVEYDEEEEEDEEEYEEEQDEDQEVATNTKRSQQVAFQQVVISRRERAARAKLRGRNKRPERKRKIPAIASNDYSDYDLPPTELLSPSEINSASAPKDEELIENGKRLEQALLNFRIGGKVVEVQPGPIVTLYEFEPAPGVKVQKIISLSDDLALSLKVASVRVYAPVPGKGTVGIEVPNTEREIVRLRDILEADEFVQETAPLALALGKNTFGDPYIADLSRMPHLLIAGATGSGKSVCINSIILSLLYRNSPADLRFIMIDPKMLELSIYEDIPHLKAPVVTSPKRARAVLWWAVEEMERRYRLMRDLGVRNLASYNAAVTSGVDADSDEDTVDEKGSPVSSVDDLLGEIDDAQNDSGDDFEGDATEPLPRIVIVVDELADLMLTVGREIEELLARLAQKARAAGIHLILATQRPSVNVITGLIKANFPARISFKVASRIDSRTILDGSGSEKLLGHGDMLFMSPTVGRIKRLHSPFVSDKEVVDVVGWVRKQGSPDYDESISAVIKKFEENEHNSGPGGGEDEEHDPLYDKAVQLVIEKGQASTSMVQRAFRIGYNRAARILETMENEGIVGPADGARPREILLGHHDDRI